MFNFTLYQAAKSIYPQKELLSLYGKGICVWIVNILKNFSILLLNVSLLTIYYFPGVSFFFLQYTRNYEVDVSDWKKCGKPK